jgi:hypothetical protein
MRGRGLRGLVPGEHVGGDGERGAQARVVRPAAARGPGEGGGRGAGGERGRPLAAGSRGHRRQELGGGEGRGRHLSLSLSPPVSPGRTARGEGTMR